VKRTENIALIIIALAMVTTIVLMLMDDFVNIKDYDEETTEGKTPYELYPDAWENSSFNPANGYLYYQGNNYEDK
jgi:hypothetical protein